MGNIVGHAFQVQITGYYCGPAATRVALSARSLFPSQDELARSLGTTVNGTDSSNNVVNTLNAYLGAGTYAAVWIPGQDATAAQRDQLGADVQRSVDAGYAVVANVVGSIITNDGSKYTYAGGHYVTIVGYDDQGNVFVSDIAVREYWVTLARMATWIAARSYSTATVAAPAPPPPAGERPWPAYMPAGHYFGLITGPPESHGGFYPAEKPDVTAIQVRLQELGYAPGGRGWADGLFEQATADAVTAWQRVAMPGTTFYGQVWPDDWAVLFAPAVTPPPPDPPPTPDPPPVQVGDTFLIVDLASYQDQPTPSDLASFKAAGVQAVNIKTSEGMTYTWDRAKAYADSARAVGLSISTFHYLKAGASGGEQARRAFKLLVQLGNGSADGIAHSCDCEADADLATVTEYIATMQQLMGRPIFFYTGDWWINSGGRDGWNIRALTPYLWAAPNDGYLAGYPGDDSPQWHAGYAGYDTLSAMQFMVAPLSGAPGNVSKTMMRKGVWSALTTAPPPTPVPPPAGCDADAIAAAVAALLAPQLLTPAQVEEAAFRAAQRAEDA